MRAVSSVARQPARDDEVELDLAERLGDGARLSDPVLVQRNLGRVHERSVGSEVGHLRVAHEIQRGGALDAA